MPSTFINLFDFKTVFMDYLLGAPALAAFALIIAISFASAYLQMSGKIYGFILVISSVIFALYIGQALFFLLLVMVGLIIFRIFARYFA